MATFFVQPCPTCGRNLEVRIQYLGRKVVCQHCRAEFLAQEGLSAAPGETVPTEAPAAETRSPLMARAEQLLALFDETGVRRPTAPV
jgi:hypothetical protein